MRFPHTFIEHQRRDRFFEESKNAQRQSSAGQSLSRSQVPRVRARATSHTTRPSAAVTPSPLGRDLRRARRSVDLHVEREPGQHLVDDVELLAHQGDAAVGQEGAAERIAQLDGEGQVAA